MSPSESQEELPSPAGSDAPFLVDPKTLQGLPLGQIIARVGMLEGALRESEDRLRLLVDAVTEYAIFTLDPDGVIESWNTGAERMKGYTHDEALGLDFSLLFLPEAREDGRPQQLLDQALAHGTHEHTGWLLKKDGTPFWSDVVISSMLDDRGHHTGFVVVVRDLTEQHRLEAAKNSFFNAFKHDFKMPITAILGFAELLKDGEALPQERFVERIESNASRLLTMVEELIDYAGLRSGQLLISLEVVEITSLAHLAVAKLASSAETSRVRVAAEAPVRVLADPAALDLVVANLITNALKSSPEHSDVIVACEQIDDVGVLTISSQGSGIRERDLSSIFLEFERGRLAQHDDSDSSPGLASVQRLIDRQGGAVALTSEVNGGTTVTIRLPLAPDPASRPPSRSRQGPPSVRSRTPGHAPGHAGDHRRLNVGAGPLMPGGVRSEADPTRVVEVGARNAPERALADLVESAHFVPDYALPGLFEQYGQAIGARRAVAYLADLQSRSLSPLLDPQAPVRDSHGDVLSVDRTIAGRAFQHLEVVRQVLAVGESPEGDSLQVWLPLVDGTERLGVLAVSVPDADALEVNDGALQKRLLTFASVAAELIVTKTKYGDSLVRLRRTSEMTLAAEMLWSLLPPLVFVSDEVTITGALEPAYEVGGDTLDFSVDPGVAHLAVFDAMGHGLPSAQLSALAVSAYRNARRGRQPLPALARSIDSAVTSVFGADAYATGVVVELDTETGVLRWINAGHPAPLLLRNGRLVRALRVEPTLPFGLGGFISGQPVHVGHEHLEPGDMVLLHSDGVIEARSSQGGFFGTERLVELVTRHLAAGLQPTETIRRVTLALLEHHQGRLSDDASLLLLQYRPKTRT